MSSPERETADQSERLVRLYDRMRQESVERQAAVFDSPWRIGLLFVGIFLAGGAFLLLFVSGFAFLSKTLGSMAAFAIMGLTMAAGSGAALWFALRRR